MLRLESTVWIILERIAAEFSGRVTVEVLREKNLLPENDPGYSGLEEMSKEQIKTMLERGYSKRILRISWGFPDLPYIEKSGRSKQF